MINKFKNLYCYIVNMSKYYMQCVIEQGNNTKDNNFALMFHTVSNDIEDWDNPEYAITSDSFKKLIRLLQEEEFVFCTPEQFFQKNKRKKILLTFDDVYRSIYTEVFPYLKMNRIPFVAFQTVSFLKQDRYLNETMIKEMLEYDLFSLGTHTVSHCNLHECKEYRYEIAEPINIFRNKFNVTPNYIAYPYGAFVTLDLKNILYAKKMYKAGFSTCSISYDKMKFKYLIPRININESNYMFWNKKKG